MYVRVCVSRGSSCIHASHLCVWLRVYVPVCHEALSMNASLSMYVSVCHTADAGIYFPVFVSACVHLGVIKLQACMHPCLCMYLCFACLYVCVSVCLKFGAYMRPRLSPGVACGCCSQVLPICANLLTSCFSCVPRPAKCSDPLLLEDPAAHGG